MHLPAVQHQFFPRYRHRRQLPLVSLSFLAVYCLPLWVTVMIPPGDLPRSPDGMLHARTLH